MAPAYPNTCWRPYGPDSPFNTALTPERRKQVSPRSNECVANWVKSWSKAGGAPGFSVGQADTRDDWDHPIYVAQPTDPKYKIIYRENWGNGNGARGAVIPCPRNARPAGGGDAHMTVLTPDGWEYDFWQAQKPANGQIVASYGGRTKIDGDGLGVAATESHFGLIAGLIRPQEVANNWVNHALFMVINSSDGTTVWPAEPQPHNAQPGMPPYGAHFYLDYTPEEINAAPWPEYRKAIVRAAATYGFYFGDTGGGSLKPESGSSFTSYGLADPWIDVAINAGIKNTPWGGHPSFKFDLTTGVDWAKRTKMLVPAK